MAQRHFASSWSVHRYISMKNAEEVRKSNVVQLQLCSDMAKLVSLPTILGSTGSGSVTRGGIVGSTTGEEMDVKNLLTPFILVDDYYTVKPYISYPVHGQSQKPRGNHRTRLCRPTLIPQPCPTACRCSPAPSGDCIWSSANRDGRRRRWWANE